MVVRPPAVAGTFYPADPVRLRGMVTRFLNTATSPRLRAAVSPDTIIPTPKAIIVPHAGYTYSGQIAAAAYVQVASLAEQIERVVMLGPAHTMAIQGLATTSANAFQTPLGNVAIDKKGVQQALSLPYVQVVDEAHTREHSLEVHLPFLQEVLGEFSLVPFLVGHASQADVAEVIDLLWGGSETLVVISSDLSHFLDYDHARKLDAATCEAIEKLRPDDIERVQACGRRPIQGLLRSAQQHNLSAVTLDLRNSGDTAGMKDRVVGYGAWVIGA